MKCIPVETITKNLVRAHLTYEDGTEGLGYTAVCFGSVIKNEDYQVDAVPVVHGHWTECRAKRVCSVCRAKVCAWVVDCTLKYCPSCGAKMDEGVEE